METQLTKRIRKKSILFDSPSIAGILDLLSHTEEPIRYHNLFYKSRIFFKKSFGKYLDFCVKSNLIVNEKVFGRQTGKPIESWFVITVKGRMFQEMLK